MKGAVGAAFSSLTYCLSITVPRNVDDGKINESDATLHSIENLSCKTTCSFENNSEYYKNYG